MPANNDDSHRLKFTLRAIDGIAGQDNDGTDPLSRTLNSFMKDSTLLPTYTQAYLADDDGPVRWLGSLIRSAGNRIIFFPGFKHEIIKLLGATGNINQFDRTFRLDHISLELNDGSWHMTTPRSKEHQGGPRTVDLGNGRQLWFGLSLASVSVMRELFQETVVTFNTSAKGARWKKTQFIAAREGKVFQTVSMPPLPPYSPVFPLISVIVGPKGFESYQGPNWGWPYGSKFVHGAPSNGMMQISAREHRLQLDSEIDIQVTSIWAPGSLTIPAVLTSPSSDSSNTSED